MNCNFLLRSCKFDLDNNFNYQTIATLDYQKVATFLSPKGCDLSVTKIFQLYYLKIATLPESCNLSVAGKL